MADRKANNIPSSSANLLFSAEPEFNFSLPFIPVSQATGPAVLSGDDVSEVGEEDSFLGQTSSAAPQASPFSYFSNTTNSSDPFASIGQQPCPPPASSPSPASIAASLPLNPPISHMNPVQQYGSVINQIPVGTYTHPPNAPTPPPPTQSSQQSYNPYRHTAVSSKANPYLMAPELQHQPPSQTPQHLNPYSQATPAPSFQTPHTAFTKPPPTQIPPPPTTANMTGPLVPSNSMVPYAYNVYEPVQPHWFYCKQVESKMVWLPFSILDSICLEETFNSVQPDPENVIVCTDGGRYDVQLYDRSRTAVYWEEEPTEVRRCTWFYKGDTDSRFIPYSEEFSEKLEAEYKKAVTTNQWHRRLEFPSGETIVMHNPKVIVQFQPSAMPDEWGTTQDGQTRPRIVKRGVDDDHDEVPDVDDFRSVSLKLLQSHFTKARDDHLISRVEFLPVHWHTALHGDATGVDRRIKKITLPSTGRLRHFTNETLLDVLFYNSPTYCQTIMDTVAFEINRLHSLFMQRNPDFKGRVSVAGHSLGSLILFDLLSNQKTGSPSAGPVTNGNALPNVKQVSPVIQANEVLTVVAAEEESKEEEEEIGNLSSVLEKLGLSEYLRTFETEKIDVESLLMCTIDDLKEMSIPLGPRKKLANFVKEKSAKQAARKAVKEKTVEKEEPKETQLPVQTEPTPDSAISKLPAGRTMSSIHVDYNYFEIGTGQVSVVYHALDFEPVNFFALGSPIGMFLTVRGVEKIEESYQLPTCKGFFNIYHPVSVAYRIEPMILPDIELEPVLIPHHKGRKRLHLELKESLSRMGSDIKQGFISSLKSAWQTLNEFARAHTSSAQLHEQLAMVASQIKAEEEKQQGEEEDESPEPQKEETQVKVGMLNGGKRIDYVLQEKPIESFNEYLFALQSHLCYWESEDTALLLLKEIYKTMNILPDQAVH
uniref:DDHD domain-containing protein n=1 Tax=Sinocyclocheilus grahami TaxID=75366 RepID=A0A672P2E9_SINGR